VLASAKRSSFVAVLDRRAVRVLGSGDRDPSGARAGAILQGLIAREPAERRPTIRGWLASGFLPPQVTIVERRVTRCDDDSAAVAVRSCGAAARGGRCAVLARRCVLRL